MDVTVTRRYKENNKAAVSSYSYTRNASSTPSKGVDSTVITGTSNPIPLELPFMDTETPAVEDYNTNYFSVYGKNPIFKCIVFDEDDNELEQLQVPKRFCTDGVLIRAEYDLAAVGASSGKIIIYKG